MQIGIAVCRPYMAVRWNNMRACGIAIALVFALAEATLPAPADAQEQQQLTWCNSKEPTAVDRRISGCTAMIQSNKSFGKDLAGVFNNRGIAYREKGDYDRALADYNEAIRLDPNHAAAFNNRGLAYFHQKDFDRAIQNYDQAIRLDPTNALAFNNRGVAYFDKRDDDRAIADYNEAIKLDPAGADAYLNRGNAYAVKKDHDYDRAIQDYDTAIRLNPNADGFYARGRSYQAKKEYDRAITDFDTALRLNPHHVLSITNRGRSYQAKKDYGRAIADYGTAIRLNPKDAGMLNTRCWARAIAGQLQLALADCNESLRLRPDGVNTLDSRGFVYFKLGQYAHAIADYDAVLKINPKMAGSLYGRGLSKLKKGDPGGDADTAAAVALRPGIVEEYAGYEVKTLATPTAQTLSQPAHGKLDRRRLPLQEALAGHWYLKKYHKNEYFEIVSHSGPVKMTWDSKGGTEVSKSEIINAFRAIDEKRNTLILTYKSDDGKHVYFNRYTFSPDRNSVVEQSLDANMKPQYDPYSIVYVDSKSRSQYVR